MATSRQTLTIEAVINAPVEKVWRLWNTPGHVTQWNHASDDWHSPGAENDLRPGGRFVYRMEAKDGSFGFDFAGTYTRIEDQKLIAYTMDDGRKVETSFSSNGDTTVVASTFEAEDTNPVDMQQAGWQAILDNFKKYTEAYGILVKLHFEKEIEASPEKVYDIMLAGESYKAWTAEFNPTSFYRGSWDKGAKILFIGTDEDGNEGGMVSRIRENIPGRFVSIESYGILHNGEEITSGPAVEAWAGGLENYTFTPSGNGTLLLIDVDTNLEYKSYFTETWPKALAKLKAICES